MTLQELFKTIKQFQTILNKEDGEIQTDVVDVEMDFTGKICFITEGVI